MPSEEKRAKKQAERAVKRHKIDTLPCFKRGELLTCKKCGKQEEWYPKEIRLPAGNLIMPYQYTKDRIPFLATEGMLWYPKDWIFDTQTEKYTCKECY